MRPLPAGRHLLALATRRHRRGGARAPCPTHPPGGLGPADQSQIHECGYGSVVTQAMSISAVDLMATFARNDRDELGAIKRPAQPVQ